MKRLENKCVLITGGTSGIGAETARLFAEEGARVVITGRSVQKGQALAKSLGNSVEFFEADISDEKIKDIVPNIKTGADPVIVGKHIIKERVEEKISYEEPVDKEHNF